MKLFGSFNVKTFIFDLNHFIQMKLYKKTNQSERITIIAENVVYFLYNGEITKSFPYKPEVFDLSEYNQIFTVITGFQEKIDTYNQNKKLERERKELIRLNEHKLKQQTKLTRLLEFKNWRYSDTPCYMVLTCESENSDRNCDPNNIETVLFFTKVEAYEYFNEVKETEPNEVGYYFETQMFEFIPKNKLEYISEDDLIDDCFNGNSIEHDTYAKPIEKDHIIITLYHGQHGSSGRYERAEFPRTWSGYLSKHGSYYCKQETLADLAVFQDRSYTYYQTSMSINDAIETYGVKVLRDLDITKEEAIQYEIYEEYIEEFYSVDEEDE